MGKNNAGNIPDSFSDGNEMFCEPKATSNAPNNYFTDIGPILHFMSMEVFTTISIRNAKDLCFW